MAGCAAPARALLSALTGRRPPQITNPKGALNVARRTWDKEEFARRADEREAAEEAGGAVVDEVKADDDLEKRLYRKAESAAAGPMNSQRAFLQARDFDLRMESRLYRTKVGRWLCGLCCPGVVGVLTHRRGRIDARAQVVNPNNTQDTSSFYCKLCDCSLKDNVAWIDHINGKKRASSVVSLSAWPFLAHTHASVVWALQTTANSGTPCAWSVRLLSRCATLLIVPTRARSHHAFPSPSPCRRVRPAGQGPPGHDEGRGQEQQAQGVTEAV